MKTLNSATIGLCVRLVVAALVILLGYMLFYFPYGNKSHGAIFFVALLATYGWIFTTHVARQNQIEKNSFDLIHSYAKDSRYVELREIITRAYSPYQAISLEDSIVLMNEYFDAKKYENKLGKDFPVGYHLAQLLNFYEYVATGVDKQFLSEPLIKEYFSSTFYSFYLKKGRYFIAQVRLKEVGDSPEKSVSSRYSNFLTLLKRWHPDLFDTPRA